MLRLLLDENLSPETTEFLRSLGHDVVDTRSSQLSGASDLEILNRARRENRIVVTFNSDFADIQEIPLRSHPGVIRLRVLSPTVEVLHPILKTILAFLEREDILGCLVVVDNWRVRIRRK